MSYRDDVLKTLEDCSGVILDATERVYSGPKKIATYVISIGLECIKSKKRRERRQELKKELKPVLVKGKVTGSVIFSKASKTRLLKATQELFGDDGWMIGEINLGDFTKEQLLLQAAKERDSAKGSLRNAQFYEALAEPLQAGQFARDYWKSETAHKIKQEIWKDTEARRPDLV
jgi:hypothetical protein